MGGQQRQRRCAVQRVQLLLQGQQRAAVLAVGQHGVAQHLHTVGQAAELAQGKHRFVHQRQQAGAQGQQVASQVAAVHGRDVEGRQRFQRQGVVPVVEVPAMALQTGHARQGLIDALQQARRTQVAKVMGGQMRQQGHAHIGW